MPPINLSVERVRDLKKWRKATEDVAADYYTLELMLALYDHAPGLLAAAEEWFELRKEVEELRERLEQLRTGVSS
ncbi:MAG TPA: hypothetical protein VLV48_08345 [Thermoanaerobaculia bacterium]|nr:hypothetical protein [Thermoanaerobaculia bacterium]